MAGSDWLLIVIVFVASFIGAAIPCVIAWLWVGRDR